ncbi:unnamed protein product [Urochloa humidicola]
MTDMSLLVSIVVALSLSSATAAVVAGAGDCPGAYRKMTMEAACSEATAAGDPKPTYQTCVDTLGQGSRAGSVHEASEYAYNAAARAVLVYPGAKSWAALLLKNASLSGEEKAAYELCARGYDEADAAMKRVWKRVAGVRSRNAAERCGVGLGDEYRTALRGVGACRDRVVRLRASPIVTMVKDNDVTLVAYVIGKLIGAK